jgi:hypothetical protein
MYTKYNEYNNSNNLAETNNEKDDDTQYEQYSDAEYNNKQNYKQDYECIYEYSIYDMEMDLLNTYSSLYSFHMNIIKDIKTIDKIEKQYIKIKNKKEIVLNDNLKKLISDIDTEINKYKLLLNQEVSKQSVFKNFKYGFGIGMGVGIIISAGVYLYKGDT